MNARRSTASPRSTNRRPIDPRHRLRIQSTTENGGFAERRNPCKGQCGAPCRKRARNHEPLRQAADRLRAHLEHSLTAPDTVAAGDLAAFVSALALTEIALRTDEATCPAPATIDRETVSNLIPLAESVVDYPVYETSEIEAATERFLWRRELEDLWRKHITKDEFHRPVVRSLGLPVLVIVDHVRAGRSWKSICENYPGLVWDDVRAAVSMATECGWLADD